LNARGQFEPVMRAGGDWRNLPPVSAAGQARIDTILNLALDGRLPDLTHGARFFQNPTIVARRAGNGQVSTRLVNFGGASPSAVIGVHAFYVDVGSASRPSGVAHRVAVPRSEDDLIVAGGRGATVDSGAQGADPAAEVGVQAVGAGDPSQALFVGADGVVRDGSR
jgi:hypothetical protein